MSDEIKAGLYCAAYVVVYTIALYRHSLAILAIATFLFTVGLLASKRVSDAEKRLRRYTEHQNAEIRKECEDDH